MPRSADSLNKEDLAILEACKPRVQELLFIYRLNHAACCKVLRKFRLTIKVEDFGRRVRKWGYRKNNNRSDYEYHARKQPVFLSSLSNRQREDLARKNRGVKRYRLDLPSAISPSVRAPIPQHAPEFPIVDDHSPSPELVLAPDWNRRQFTEPEWQISRAPVLIGDVSLPSEAICTALILQLQNGTAAEVPSSGMEFDEFGLLGTSSPMHTPVQLLLNHIVGQKVRLDPQLDLVKSSGPASIPAFDTRTFRSWDIRFLQSVINYTVYIANNNIANPRKGYGADKTERTFKMALWHIGNQEEFRTLVTWVIKQYPTVTRKFADMLLKNTIRVRDKSRAVDITALGSEEDVANQVLRHGKSWCVDYLVEKNIIFKDQNPLGWNKVIPNDELYEHLDTIITGPKTLTEETVKKICKILQNSVHGSLENDPGKYSILHKYSDSNQEYEGRDLGTKLFLLASHLIGKERNSRGSETESSRMYRQFAKYMIKHCIRDHKKAFINAIRPISYTSRISVEAGGKTDPLFNTKPPILDKIHPYQGVELLMSEMGIDIDTQWPNNRDRKYHVLTLALQHRLPPHVVSFLLKAGASVDIVVGSTSITSFKIAEAQVQVPMTPLHQALFSKNLANLELILSQNPRVDDPIVCLLLAGGFRPLRRRELINPQNVRGSSRIGTGSPGSERVDQPGKRNLMTILQSFLREQAQVLSEIAQDDEVYAVIADGRQDILEELLRARTGSLPSSVIFKALKDKKPGIFKLMLPARDPNGSYSSRKSVLVEVLKELEQDPKFDDIICIHNNHKYKGMTAHRPTLIYHIWDEILEHQIEPSKWLWQRMVTPIWWSAVWDNKPYQQRSAGLLLTIMRRFVNQDITFDVALRQASDYAKPQFLSAMSQRFDSQHANCFDQALKTAVWLDWDLTERMGNGLTTLHFAVAISRKTALSVIRPEILAKLTLDEKSRLFVLATYYGHRDIIEMLIKEAEDGDRDWRQNMTSTLKGFNPLKPPDIEHPIQGITTPLHVAAFQRRKDIICLLLDKGADVDMVVPRHKKDGLKSTALDIAAAQGSADIVDIILKYNPRAWIVAADIALERHHPEIHNTIRSYGMSPPPQSTHS
ncbi:hypothetical protein AOL_s00078g425 [Orbilia oligospora ATCC 24927]|uniref:Uncharacterized protein n=1 Tax=Arthrobotrys oligospora (strain ATCC 24927 / CBS 115.81 / DSM 1491) TaxID=756982 RepID=G1XBX8_ARTOA|nr:hypothetical protein AOL_s00078g425 [Orbilia oligospora ATCC 24927]EGX49392.1 hypothetical protein AOL_s00078g425 [Orbilia oligospora ATCC 24927]